VYVGALDAYKVDLDVFRALRRVAGTDLRLKIVGGLEFADADRERAVDGLGDPPEVTVGPAVAREKLGATLATADFGIVAMRCGRYSRASFPLKYWDYQWAGLPTLAVGCAALIGLPGVVSCESASAITPDTLAELRRLRSSAREWQDHADRNDARARVRRMTGC
jgi:hypothetical protein